MGSQHFRAGVVAVVERGGGDVLVFERADAPGHWQLPQGGIEGRESPREAVWRELTEETGLGTGDVALAGEHPEWVAYEWPPHLHRNVNGGRRIGQVQRWFLFRPVGPDVSPRPDGREFSTYTWVERDWLVEHVIEMRRAAYRQVLGELR